MSSLALLDALFIGTVLEGLFYGLYCVIFVLYIRIYISRKSGDKTILIYPLSTLFILCTVYFAIDFVLQYLTIMRGQGKDPLAWVLNITASTIYSFIDFIAQGVLIYRCWLVWNRRLLVVVIPFILSLTSLATSLALIVELHSLGVTREFAPDPPSWFSPVGISSFSLSLAVNAIFTGLLVFKIAKASVARNEGNLRHLVSMLIESGIVLFVVQLVWVIFFSLDSNGFHMISGWVAMIYGAIPTLIVVRVGMRDAYYDQTSSLEHMQFASSTNVKFGS